MTQIQKEIEDTLAAVAKAKADTGEMSIEATDELDHLEELELKAIEQGEGDDLPLTKLQRYCLEHPEADECRLYDD